MNSTFRWALLGVVIAVNAAVSFLLDDTWYGAVINVVSGLIVVGLVLDYFIRGREN